MGIKEELEVDIKNFLNQLENQDYDDQVVALRLLFDKYLHLNTCDYLMNYFDLQEIVNASKNRFVNSTLPVNLEGRGLSRKLSQEDQRIMLIAESTIGFLNKNDCLKKLPKFNKLEK